MIGTPLTMSLGYFFRIFIEYVCYILLIFSFMFVIIMIMGENF